MFSVYIRTHSERVHLALQLYSNIEREFKTETRLLNTGESSADYTEKFISLLGDALSQEQNAYILILEDDMLFCSTAYSEIVSAIQHEMPYIWFSIPHNDILENSAPLCANFRQSYIKNNLYYSGSILIQASLLRAFLRVYVEQSRQLGLRNFDVNLSKFLIREIGHNMFFCASQFGTDPSIKSSISNNNLIKQDTRFEGQALCDPLFDVSRAIFRYREDNIQDVEKRKFE
jgi:GR25 family glycosyltransferase involved in LPS biosynthesis